MEDKTEPILVFGWDDDHGFYDLYKFPKENAQAAEAFNELLKHGLIIMHPSFGTHPDLPRYPLMRNPAKEIHCPLVERSLGALEKYKLNHLEELREWRRRNNKWLKWFYK